jgi:hypothetical protein
MPLDTSDLRTADDSFPPIKDRIVTLIRIANRRVTQAYTVTDKREMLGSLKPADTLLALWTGQWHTDVFQMPKEMVTRWKKELLS